MVHMIWYVTVCMSYWYRSRNNQASQDPRARQRYPSCFMQLVRFMKTTNQTNGLQRFTLALIKKVRYYDSRQAIPHIALLSVFNVFRYISTRFIGIYCLFISWIGHWTRIILLHCWTWWKIYKIYDDCWSFKKDWILKITVNSERIFRKTPQSLLPDNGPVMLPIKFDMEKVLQLPEMKFE